MAAEDQKQEKKFHPVDPAKVKDGDIMAFVYYTKVDNVLRNGETLVVSGLTSGTPSKFTVDGRSLVVGSLSADQYHETVQVSMTDAAIKLTTSFNKPLTVCFTKKDGSERVLRGRLLGEEPHLGYSWVEDLDITNGNKIREVNHREIKWLVVDGVRYQVRGKK